MNRTVLINAFVAAALVQTASAFAADYDSGVVREGPESSYTNVEYGSGWYLRGDIGVSLSVESSLSYATDFTRDYTSQSIDTDYSASFGAGYIFNDFLRADLLVDFFSGGSWSGTRTEATTIEPTGCGVGETGNCFSNDSANFEITSGTLNGYVSLGRWGAISPYAGAGLGLAHVAWSGYNSTPVCELDPGETCGLGVHSGGLTTETFTGPTTSFSSEESINLMYALMFGVDYKVSDNWTVDVGYRFSHIDGDLVLASSSTGLGGNSEFDGITLHEVRAGLRYEIW